MTNAANEYVLKLNTDGAVWTNQIGVSGVSFETTPVYADMLVKFVPSETLPTFVSVEGGKFAIAIKTNGLGTTVLNLANNTGADFTWKETAQEISTTTWYRVTVKMYVEGEYSYSQTYINGATVGSPLLMNADTNFNAIGFQGTGYIDEVVVRDDDPFGGVTPPPVVLITLSLTTGIQSVLVSGTGTNAAPVVPSGTVLDVFASTFYQIVGQSGVTNQWTSLGLTNGTITVTADADATATFTAQPWTSTNALGWGSAFANAPATNVAAWAIANGVSSLSDGIYTNYLYNIDDATAVPELLIKSIAVTNTTVTVTVGAGTNNLSIINGVLKLKAWPVLGGTPVTYTNEVPIAGTTNVTVQVDISTNKFVKALIE
jgi:hypothetical protein